MDYDESDVTSVPQHNDSVIRLHQTHPEYDSTNRVKALEYLAHPAAKGEVVIGLLSSIPTPKTSTPTSNIVETSFNKLSEMELCPGAEMLEKINAALR